MAMQAASWSRVSPWQARSMQRVRARRGGGLGVVLVAVVVGAVRAGRAVRRRREVDIVGERNGGCMVGSPVAALVVSYALCG